MSIDCLSKNKLLSDRSLFIHVNAHIHSLQFIIIQNQCEHVTVWKKKLKRSQKSSYLTFLNVYWIVKNENPCEKNNSANNLIQSNFINLFVCLKASLWNREFTKPV